MANGAAALKRERTSSNLDTEGLSNHIFAGTGWLERQERVLGLLKKEELFNKQYQLGQSRVERFSVGLQRAKRLRQLADQHGWTADDSRMAGYLIDDPLPFDLHAAMFITTLRQQASDEQQALWLPDAEAYRIIGAYAQTELGHGSNIRGIETEALWDQTTKTFVLHSPTLTACKWWIGGLGRTAQYAVVMAQLVVPQADGVRKSYGPHPFVVQIRDLKTHKPLPGITIGDIGPKLGYTTMDNGYMLFHQHRVQHIALLSRFARLDPDTGVYSKPENPSLMYGSMTFARIKIIDNARLVLARALTISIRYTCVRRQFPDRDNAACKEEMVVLDYPTVQIRLFPLLSTVFALHYAGRAMERVYEAYLSELSVGDSSRLSIIHSISSGLKSLATSRTADGLEVCRRALGGHGFSGSSGFPLMIQGYISKPTVEGDNWMITQQLSSFLMKKAGLALKGSNNLESGDPWIRNLREFKRRTQSKADLDILTSDEAIVNAFNWRAADLTFKLYEKQVIQKQPWNTLLVEMHQLSNAQSTAYLVEQFLLGLKAGDSPAGTTRNVLLALFRLFAFSSMQRDALDFLSASVVSLETLNWLHAVIQGLMADIRPHAVKLVDAWKMPEYLLNSALGRSDGKVYEALFREAHFLNPLNKMEFNPRYWVLDSKENSRSHDSSKL
ncbi:hypothetical protein BJX62DRAFT_231494 [Aspergillus germanicus]